MTNPWNGFREGDSAEKHRSMEGLRKLGSSDRFIIPAVRRHMAGAPRVRAGREGGGFGFDCLVACRGASRFLSGGLLASGVYKV